MMRRLCFALCAVLLLHAPVDAQTDENRVLTAAGGGVLGVLGGGYVALSVVVAEARAGRYIHDVDDVLGWRSLPVLAGGTLGTLLGAYSPKRLRQAVLYGFGGMAAGGVLGLGAGELLWTGPEAKWAGAAIGAGAGLAIAYLVGAITAEGDEDLGRSNGTSLSVPIGIRIAVP